MYEESAFFDPNSMMEEGQEDTVLCQGLQTPPPPQTLLMAGSSSNSHNSYDTNTNNNNNISATDQDLSNFHNDMGIQQMSNNFTTHLLNQESCNQILGFNSPQDSNFAQTADLLNLFHLPNSSISFTNPNHNHTTFVGDLPMNDTASNSSILYDPLFHLNLPPQPPLFRDLFQSLPNHGYSNLPRNGSLFVNGGDDDNINGVGIQETGGGSGIYQENDGEQQFDNGILDFSCWDMSKGRDGNGKMTKHFATERQRRQHFNDKFTALRELIPTPTKNDRASIVGDAIGYVKELLRTVNELKILVEKKRIAKGRNKRLKTEEDSIGNNGHENSTVIKPLGDPDQSFNNGSLRSSWLQRKSKDTEVDVRIIDDEVTIKLVQRKKINCLLFVSKVLDELQLDLHHVAGGHVGDYYSFLFNTKIYEGSSVYATAIANKLIEVVDRQSASTPSTSCY